MRSRHAAAPLILAAAVLAPGALAQSAPGYWFQLPAPLDVGHQLHYPVLGGRLLSFGQSNTDEVYLRSLASDSTWHLLHPSNSGPGTATGRASVYDAANGRLLVVGGPTPGAPAQLWSLSLVTATWSLMSMTGTPPTSPLSTGVLHAIWDPDSSRLLVVDSLGTGASLWIARLSGTPGWSHRAMAGVGNPGNRVNYADAWDPANRRWLFHGGQSSPFPMGDTWALHADGGAVWEALPFPEQDDFHHVMFVDAALGELILADGGTVGGTYPQATWQVFTHPLTGNGAWTVLSPAADDLPIWGSTAYDAAHHTLYKHGSSDGGTLRRLDLGAPSSWALVDTDLMLTVTGPGRDPVPFVLDTRRHQIIVAGLGASGVELWSYARNRSPAWTPLPVTGSLPPRRQRGVAAYDSLRDRVLIHGGSLGSTATYQDTWACSLTGTPQWTKLGDGGPIADVDPVSPAMVDPALDRMLIGHARDGVGANPGLYSWDLAGAPNWHRIAVTGLGPDSTLGGASAFDPATRRWIFHLGGGRVGSMQFSGPGFSWLEWTGITGTPTDVGAADGGVIDPVGRRFVVFGDGPLATTRSGAWAIPIDATPVWAAVGVNGTAPYTRKLPYLVYDPATDAVTMTGGYSAVFALNDVYELRFERGDVRVTGVGSGTKPAAFLLRASPQPARGRVSLRFILPSSGPARVRLFDAAGRAVLSREIGTLTVGDHAVVLPLPASLGSGVYWAALEVGARRVTTQIVLLH